MCIEIDNYLVTMYNNQEKISLRFFFNFWNRIIQTRAGDKKHTQYTNKTGAITTYNEDYDKTMTRSISKMHLFCRLSFFCSTHFSILCWYYFFRIDNSYFAWNMSFIKNSSYVPWLFLFVQHIWYYFYKLTTRISNELITLKLFAKLNLLSALFVQNTLKCFLY